MLETYNLKSLKDIECLKHIIPKGYTILSNKNSDMIWSNLGACGTIVLANIYFKKDLRRLHICLCIKEWESGFATIAVYIVETPEEFTKTANYIKNEFEMKDLGKI